MLRTFLEKRRLKKTLGKYIDQEALESLTRGDFTRPSLQEARIEYIFAYARASNASEISTRVGAVVDLAVSQRPAINHLIGPLVVMTYGTTSTLPANSDQRAPLIQVLGERFKSDIKIVHGTAIGHHGPIGSDQYFFPSFIVPNFDGHSRHLDSAAFWTRAGGIDQSRPFPAQVKYPTPSSGENVIVGQRRIFVKTPRGRIKS